MKHLFYIFFIFLITHSFAQTREDSLLLVLKQTTDDYKKADLLKAIALEYTTHDNNKSIDYVNQSIELSKKINYSKGVIEGLNQLALNERTKGNYSRALIHLKEAFLLAQKESDLNLSANSLLNIGDVYSTLKNYNKAILHYQKAYDIYLKENNRPQLIICLSRIGNRTMDVGGELKDSSYFFKAINIYEAAKQLALTINDKSKNLVLQVNLADAYNILGKHTGNKFHLFHSINYSLQVLKFSREFKISKYEGIAYLNLGESYENLGVISKAIFHYEMALQKYIELDDKPWIINTCKFLAKANNKLGYNTIALDHLNKGLVLAKKQNSKENLRDYYELLAKVYRDENDYKKAFEYLDFYGVYNDSILTDNASIQMARLQTDLDLIQKDNQIALLTKNTAIQNNEFRIQRIQRNSLIAGIIGVFVLLVFIFYRYREKQKSELEILKAKNIAEQAKEAQELFLANTSHEIRTPMNGIMGMTRQLQDSDLDKEQQEYVNAIAESSNNLLVIVNDLLDLSKIRAGKMIFDNRVFKLEDVFKNLAYSLQYRVEEKKIKLTYDIDTEIPQFVLGDSVRLSQILLNLAGNAVKFTEKGYVRIEAKLQSVTDKKVNVLFAISDSGIGIPKDKLKNIFDSFTQVNSKTTKKYAGTGLGLSIAKQLIEQQGGLISVQSEVNKGSVFTFSLQFEKVNNRVNTTILIDNNDIVASSIFNKVKILIVDDNKINQKVASLALQKWKAKIKCADDATIAIDYLKKYSFDIVLMDLSMPEIDGYEATKIIRTTLGSRVPIIAITASALLGEKEKCLEAGMDDYISKPFNPIDLFEKIKGLLPAEKLTDTEMVVDLTNLYQRAEGDIEYLKDILGSYMVEMPVYLSEFKAYYNSNDISKLAAQAHKMRSPLALLGAKKVVGLLLELEKGIKSSNVVISEEIINEIVTGIEQSITEVEQELNLIAE